MSNREWHEDQAKGERVQRNWANEVSELRAEVERQRARAERMAGSVRACCDPTDAIANEARAILQERDEREAKATEKKEARMQWEIDKAVDEARRAKS